MAMSLFDAIAGWLKVVGVPARKRLIETFPDKSSWRPGCRGWLHFADEHTCFALRVPCPGSAVLWAVCRPFGSYSAPCNPGEWRPCCNP